MRAAIRRLSQVLLALALLAALALGAAYGYLSHPSLDHNPLDPSLISLDSPQGQALLASAVRADLDGLQAALQSQEKRSWCGVASGATALSALRGARLSQSDLLRRAEPARSWARVTFTGMPLDALAAILVANGARASATHAGETTVDSFRATLDRALSDPADVLLVNYHREAIGQRGGGHISPVGAWDRAGDRALILDVATLRYPPVWVDADALFAAMQRIDSESGTSRGWVELRL